jgi:PST family polysaccharide transporter
MGVAYAVRITVLRKIGLEATGLYQSAWTLGGLYVGVILGAMGADFFPRLTASIHNRDEANRLVNEQTLVGVLLAGPGVLATLTFAPLVIALLYSAKFGAAVGLLRWICLGAMLQVITWPMGFIIVAKGKQGLFFFVELAWSIVAATLAWICIQSYGLNGAGIAFFGSYIFHAFLIYPIVHRLTGFRWSRETRFTVYVFISLIAIVFVLCYTLPTWSLAVFGFIVTLLSGVYSAKVLIGLVQSDKCPLRILKLFGSFVQNCSNSRRANSGVAG